MTEMNKPVTEQTEQKPKRRWWGLRKGGRNLILLGVVSILIATATTGISLAIYHNSGDIYLDRSRPGFLPEEGEEVPDEEQEAPYDFSKSGPLTAEVLQEYLDQLREQVEIIDAHDKPFDAAILSDKSLGIPDATEVSE